MGNKHFVFRSPSRHKGPEQSQPANYSDALVRYKNGRISLTEAEQFIESRVRKFAEPNESEIEAMRASWKKHAPKEAKDLYLPKQ